MIANDNIFILKPLEKITLLFKYLSFRKVDLDTPDVVKEN